MKFKKILLGIIKSLSKRNSLSRRNSLSHKNNTRPLKGYPFGNVMFHTENDLENYNEQQIFFFIFELSHFIQKCRDTVSMIHPEIDLTPYLKSIRKCILQTRRFGVELDEPEDGNTIILSKSYLAWYNWWENYFYQLDENESDWGRFTDKVCSGEDISEFRPKGTWKHV
jgi:hypothetical protein